MLVKDARHLIVRPALQYLETKIGPEGGPKWTPEAERMLLAIGYQESRFRDRIQGPREQGPARGFWQFEQIAVTDVMTRLTSRTVMARACTDLCLSGAAASVYGMIAFNDTLAAIAARLNLYNDLHAIPTEEGIAWTMYLHVWRPGAPHPDTWPDAWRLANEE